MKKLLLIFIMIFFVILYYNRISYAAFIESGNYLEKNQWGALEDILNDFKSGKISTNECVLFGCYVLAAHEPSRVDKDVKAKLLPSKYKLNKKSIESGPYFFVFHIYKYENQLDSDATNEFKNSDWCDESFFDNILKNPKIKSFIEQYYLKNPHVRNIQEIFCKLEKEKLITTEEYMIIVCNSESMVQRFFNKFSSFIKTNKIAIFLDGFTSVETYQSKINEIKKSSNRSFINVMNFYYKMSDLTYKYGSIY